MPSSLVDSSRSVAIPRRILVGALKSTSLPTIAAGFFLSAAFTPLLLVVQASLQLRDVDILYLIPVVIAATRWGLMPALAASLCGTAASALLFYGPIFSLKIVDPQDLLDLVLFIIVAVISSHLAAASRFNATAAEKSRRELSRLYGFSRKLALATEPGDIYAAIQEHTSTAISARVSFVARTGTGHEHDKRPSLSDLPESVRAAAEAHAQQAGTTSSTLVTDPETGQHWLLRLLSLSASSPGVLVVELGVAPHQDLSIIRSQVDALLGDAILTLERLDMSTALSEARVRRQSEALREALIWSVSHGLRTPLASIMGSASILSDSAVIKADARLSELAGIVVTEADRLNGDIQKLLDAATVSSAGLKPQLTWVEPADLVNGALEHESKDLVDHRVTTDIAPGLPLLLADPVLIVQALSLILDNAARYSPKGTTIQVSAEQLGQDIVLSVVDEGMGLNEDERALVFEKFYRGQRVRAATRGSGLGLWIANAFVVACRGRLGIAAREGGCGTRLTMILPAASSQQMGTAGGIDD